MAGVMIKAELQAGFNIAVAKQHPGAAEAMRDLAQPGEVVVDEAILLSAVFHETYSEEIIVRH
ncbi:hypothetical protein [Pantoea agglomerans]|uniref:hypothetical protein n=1 Tax=Enterobacter agglomerans TaxID=549 RepID=UPI001F3CC0CE|nr:hypothetical protein [Pantoea agglomerans]